MDEQQCVEQIQACLNGPYDRKRYEDLISIIAEHPDFTRVGGIAGMVYGAIVDGELELAKLHIKEGNNGLAQEALTNAQNYYALVRYEQGELGFR
ncbi:hypothetical protein HYY74_03280 [Candidatus Woesearchaeota archaeon]|nr:hypothetical protein [Candidatus Woesearchaeota archaeon]